MGRGPHGPSSPAPFAIDWTMLGFLLAVAVIAVLWWRGYGADFMYHRFQFCTGCRRQAVNCSCPLTLSFTAWDDLSDEEKNDAV